MAGDLFTPLHVDYQSDPKIIEAGHVAESLFVRSLAMSKRLLSDGHVNRVQLPVLCLGLPGRPSTLAERLVSVGLWTPTDDGWQVTNWLKWNPSAASLQARAARKRASSVQANHERWHVGSNGKPSDSCPLCYPDPSEPDPNRIPTRTTVGIPKGREGKGSQREGNVEDPATTDLEATASEPKRRRSWSDRTDTLTRQYRDWYKDQKGFACPQSHMVLAKIIERFAEVDRDRLVTALKACATVSVRAIELELNRPARPDVVSRTEQRRRLVDHVAQIGTPTATHPAVAAVFALPTGDRP
jgi:hypothetical protein